MAQDPTAERGIPAFRLMDGEDGDGQEWGSPPDGEELGGRDNLHLPLPPPATSAPVPMGRSLEVSTQTIITGKPSIHVQYRVRLPRIFSGQVCIPDTSV